MNKDYLNTTATPDLPLKSGLSAMKGLDEFPLLDFAAAARRLKNVVNRTPLTFNHNLSRKYQCNIFLKQR